VPSEIDTWIASALGDLPSQKAHAFTSIWSRRLLTVNGGKDTCDSIDEFSSSLIWSALTNAQNLLVVLPDLAEHRSSILLATGLIYSWLHPSSTHPFPSRRERVVYFGTHVGIREQLASVRLSSWQMRFSEAFPQYNRGRTDNEVSGKHTGAQQSESTHTPDILVPVQCAVKLRRHATRRDSGDSLQFHFKARLRIFMRGRKRMGAHTLVSE